MNLRVVLMLLLSVGLAIEARACHQVKAIDPGMTHLLEKVIIPRFELHNADLPKALELLTGFASRAGLSGQVKFSAWKGRQLPKTFLRPYQRPETPMDLVSVSLVKIPMSEIIRFISSEFGATPGQCGKTIFFIPTLGSFGPILKRRYAVPYGFRNPVQELRKMGVRFEYPGTTAFIVRRRNPSRAILVLRNLPEQLALLDWVTPVFDRLPRAQAGASARDE